MTSPRPIWIVRPPCFCPLPNTCKFRCFHRTAANRGLTTQVFTYVFLYSNCQSILVLPPFPLHKPGHSLSWQQVQLKILNLWLFIPFLPRDYTLDLFNKGSHSCHFRLPRRSSVNNRHGFIKSTVFWCGRRCDRTAVSQKGGGGGWRGEVPWHCTLDVAR